MEVTPLWVQFITPVLTIIIIIAGFAFSKVRLEQRLVDTDKNHSDRIKNIETKLENPLKCDNCPEILKIRSRNDVTDTQVNLLFKIIQENQKDTKQLIKEMAETNVKVDTTVKLVSESLEFLRSNKFATAMEKILNSPS